MGQAFRRAIGRFPASTKTSPNISRNTDKIPPLSHQVSSPEGTLEKKVESNILEERDPEYDVMLQKMIGTIKSKPGGKLEMGEAFIVQKYKRPLPRVRSSVEESGSHDHKPLLPGTLTIAQLQEIMLLRQGKSDDQKSPMDVQDIARRFGIDAAQLEQIFQFLSLPPELEEKSANKSN